MRLSVRSVVFGPQPAYCDMLPPRRVPVAEWLDQQLPCTETVEHTREGSEPCMDDQPLDAQRGSLTVSTDHSRLDVDAALDLLRTTFWGHTLDRETLTRAIANSLCFGLYDGTRLVGFGRVVTDRATYAYWTDVVTAPEYRGRGLGHWLCQCMLDHPDL